VVQALFLIPSLMIPAFPLHNCRRMMLLLNALTHPFFPLHHHLFPLVQILFQLSLLPLSTRKIIGVALAEIDAHPVGLPLSVFSPIVPLSHHLLTVPLFLPQAISVKEVTIRRSSIRAREEATGQTRTATSVSAKTSEYCHHWHLQHLVLCAGKGLTAIRS